MSVTPLNVNPFGVAYGDNRLESELTIRLSGGTGALASVNVTFTPFIGPAGISESENAILISADNEGSRDEVGLGNESHIMSWNLPDGGFQAHVYGCHCAEHGGVHDFTRD